VKKHTPLMRERIAPNSHDFSMELSEAKIKVDASRAVLQLVSDHLERGLEIRPELIGALIFQTDVSLAEASDALCNFLCAEGRV
jgi:hypothetical protein